MGAACRAGDRRCIFVTGGASGIGRATARLFCERGWFVGAYDVDEEGLASLARELGSENCLTRRLDVGDKADFDRAMEEFAAATTAVSICSSTTPESAPEAGSRTCPTTSPCGCSR